MKRINNRYDVECPKCGLAGEDHIGIMITGAPAFNYDNRMGAFRTTDSFNDRLKDMSKNIGKENTVTQVIR